MEKSYSELHKWVGWQKITYFEIIIGWEINDAKGDIPQNGGTAALFRDEEYYINSVYVKP